MLLQPGRHIVLLHPTTFLQPSQSNNELTELSSLMRRIASASNGAMVSSRIFAQRFTCSVARIESVIVIISIGDEAMRATAAPDRTPCVT